MTHMLFLIGLIGVVLMKLINWKKHGWVQWLGVLSRFLVIKAGFSIFSSPIDLRYQVFPLFIFWNIAVILFERIWSVSMRESKITPERKDSDLSVGIPA